MQQQTVVESVWKRDDEHDYRTIGGRMRAAVYVPFKWRRRKEGLGETMHEPWGPMAVVGSATDRWSG